MIEQELRLTCRDPVIARDGRPFGVGNRMRPLMWLNPGTVAGSFRTALAKAAQRDFDARTNQALLEIDIAGVFPINGERLYLPAPDDCVVSDSGRVLRPRPEELRPGEGCDWPTRDLKPVVLSEADAPDDFKPREVPAFWPLDQYANWLVGGGVTFGPSFLSGAEVEVREHVGIHPESGTADEGRLFATAGLHLSQLRGHLPPKHPLEIELAARVRVPDGHWAGPTLSGMGLWHPLGGERRLVHWRAVNDFAAWNCPGSVRQTLQNARRISLTLATPAIFSEGWRPGWLNGGLDGTPPVGGPRLRLIGVCIQRWRAVSGWSVAPLRLTGRPGPKAVKRLVPAGGVYYFEAEGSAAALADGGWLNSVCDAEQDRRDGFGLAIWGTW